VHNADVLDLLFIEEFFQFLNWHIVLLPIDPGVTLSHLPR
jgi:hypothetical protein